MTGILLVLRFWIQAWKNYVQGGGALHASVLGAELLTLTTEMILVVFVRPYLGQVVLLASLVAAIVLLAYFSMPSQLHRKKIERAHKERRVLAMVLVGFVLELMVISLSVRQQELVAPSAGEARSEEWARSIGCGVWLPSVHLPMAINQRLARLACAREAFRHGYSHAGSKIDADTGFKSPAEVLGYLPRASQIALFSPFPNQWFKDGVQPGAGVMRTLVIPEMLVFYVALPGVLLALLVSGIRAPVMMAFLFALTVVLAHVLVITNVGTLYRMRFPAMLIWILIGGIGWRAWFDRHRTKAL